MKKITKLKRSVKAISPIISVLLMIAIAVSAALVAYAWVSGYMDFTTTKVGKSIQIQSISSTAVYVQNVGESDVEIADLYVDGDLETNNIGTTLIPGATGTIALSPDVPREGNQVTIKIVTTDGISAQMTKTFATATISQGEPEPEYSVEFILGTGGGSMLPIAGTHNVGESLTIQATPDTDYVFNQWTSTGSITFANANSASTTANINSAGTITATFTYSPVTYAVDFIMGTGGLEVTPDDGSYVGDVSISATADTGYTFDQWTSTGSITFANANSASTTATVSGAGTITANFVLAAYDVEFVLGTGGASMSPTGTQSYNYGDDVAISATPATNYIFNQWTSTGSITFDASGSASTTATINSAGTITATFTYVPPTPETLTLRPSGSGSVTENVNNGGWWTSNWECVDDSTSDNDSTYVYDDNQYNGYDTDTYGTGDTGSTTGTITDVTVYIVCKKDGSSSSVSYARTALRIGGTTYYGSQTSLSNSYATISTSYASNPSGGDWSWSDIDSLQCGVSLDSGDTQGSSTSIARCTQVYVVVTYTP